MSVSALDIDGISRGMGDAGVLPAAARRYPLSTAAGADRSSARHEFTMRHAPRRRAEVTDAASRSATSRASVLMGKRLHRTRRHRRPLRAPGPWSGLSRSSSCSRGHTSRPRSTRRRASGAQRRNSGDRATERCRRASESRCRRNGKAPSLQVAILVALLGGVSATAAGAIEAGAAKGERPDGFALEEGAVAHATHSYRRLVSPSRNIRCLMQKTVVVRVTIDPCEAPSSSGARAPALCSMRCPTSRGGPVVAYGSRVRRGRFECQSRSVGMRCLDLRIGRGFVVRRQNIALF